MNDIIEKIKEKFSSVKDKALNFYEENQNLSYIILGLIALLIILIILLICTGSKVKKQKSIPVQTLELTEKLAIPDGPALPKDYTTSRKTKDKWTNEEAEEWFTVPTEKEINSLADANDSLINEIVGAAP